MPSTYARGFFLLRCDKTIGDITFEFLDYNDEVATFEDEWIDDDNGCQANRIRGVKYMIIKIDSEKGKEMKSGEIYLSQEEWFMTVDYRWYFSFIAIIVVVTQTFSMYRAKWFDGDDGIVRDIDEDSDMSSGSESSKENGLPAPTAINRGSFSGNGRSIQDRDMYTRTVGVS